MHMHPFAWHSNQHSTAERQLLGTLCSWIEKKDINESTEIHAYMYMTECKVQLKNFSIELVNVVYSKCKRANT